VRHLTCVKSTIAKFEYDITVISSCSYGTSVSIRNNPTTYSVHLILGRQRAEGCGCSTTSAAVSQTVSHGCQQTLRDSHHQRYTKISNQVVTKASQSGSSPEETRYTVAYSLPYIIIQHMIPNLPQTDRFYDESIFLWRRSLEWSTNRNRCDFVFYRRTVVDGTLATLDELYTQPTNSCTSPEVKLTRSRKLGRSMHRCRC